MAAGNKCVPYTSRIFACHKNFQDNFVASVAMIAIKANPRLYFFCGLAAASYRIEFN